MGVKVVLISTTVLIVDTENKQTNVVIEQKPLSVVLIAKCLVQWGPHTCTQVCKKVEFLW